MTKDKISIFLICLVLCFIISCEKPETVSLETLKSLYSEYKYGEIDQGIYNKKIVFSVALNMWDAPTLVYSNDGVLLGVCNWAWGPVDPICEKITNIEVIYRCEKHLTGRPPVDKYDLANL